jgi:hypothetical protein
MTSVDFAYAALGGVLGSALAALVRGAWTTYRSARKARARQVRERDYLRAGFEGRPTVRPSDVDL